VKLVSKRGKRVLLELDYADFLNLHCLALTAQKVYAEKLKTGDLEAEERQQLEAILATAQRVRTVVAADFASKAMTSL